MDDIVPALDAICSCYDDEKLEGWLSLLETEVRELFWVIKKCDHIGEANVYFEKLDKIQYVLARLVFKYHKEVSYFLRQFIRDCDRLDTAFMREYLFKKVKTGEYIF